MIFGPSNTSGKVEAAFLFVTISAIVLLAIVVVFMVVFLVKYNSKRHPKPEHVEENTKIEILWTVIPLVLVMLMFYFGMVDFDYVRNPPKDSFPVNVIGQQWSWHFRYQNGKESDVLRVPIGKPIELLMTSKDVIHSFFVPAFKIKEDCVPGMTTHLWFNVRDAGSYDVFCTEYCGLGHSHMRSQVVAMKEADFQKWYTAKVEEGAAETGHHLLSEKGCLGCHTVNGSPKVGPTFKGLYGSKVTVTTNGKQRVVTADDAYIERSILYPEADIVKGFPPVMPKLPVTKKEIKDIIAYMKTIK
jgi:cytochrome c oxidase subunit 2